MANEFKNTTARRRYDAAIGGVLTKLCVESGFCGHAEHSPFDSKRGTWTADEFALEVLRAEGMDPLVIEGIGPSQSDYFKLIRQRFVAAFGQSVRVSDFERDAI